MVFKRRDRRPVWRIVLEALWPRGGWARAATYVKYRLHRLPDTPEKIARGIWAGVFTTFTPFFGLHFLISWGLARLLRGNVIAALLATFFGNPLTYVPIAAISLQTGHFLLGRRPSEDDLENSLGETIAGAWGDLWHNFLAMFTPETAEWSRLDVFYDDFFLPFMVGSILPGIVAGSIAYYLSVPVIRAYQNRRRRVLQAKLQSLGKGAPRPRDAQ